MGEKYYIVDLSNKEFKGDILDITYEGSTVIIKNLEDVLEKDFLCVKTLPLDLGKFDTVLFFLSINKYKKRLIKDILKRLKSNLKNGATLMIWDLNYRRIKPFDNVRIKIVKKDNKVETLNEIFKFNPFSLSCGDVENILTKEGYNVTKIDDDNLMFYIEAKYTEDENEGSVSKS
ncbi:hypothetical protein SAMN05660865_00865 [Caloramator fervidus]|uniref:Methyltransferase domain-containing protein n=2 Tax=Caloramator fervidus TaxID=29344 RepID=A0A1H5UBQ3_9CLOT|nr:hypothetical protein SAMN05660865_00865 [Caloramator fervidus]